MRTLLTISALLILSGCATQRRCAEKWPPQTNYITETKIIHRDTTIYITIPADTVYRTDTVKVGADGLINYPVQRLDVRFAWSKVWIENSRLHHELKQKESVIAETIKGAVKEVEVVTEVTKLVEVERRLTWWQMTLIRGGYAFIATLVIGLFWLLIKIKKPW